MPQLKPLFNVNNPIVDGEGKMTPPFRDYLRGLSKAVLIVGTTSPEGALFAPQYTLYIDETVPTVPLQYRKMLPEIGGDIKKGWVLI